MVATLRGQEGYGAPELLRVSPEEMCWLPDGCFQERADPTSGEKGTERQPLYSGWRGYWEESIICRGEVRERAVY